MAQGVYNTGLVLDRPISIHGAGATLVSETTTGLRVLEGAVAQIYDLSIAKNIGGSTPEDRLAV